MDIKIDNKMYNLEFKYPEDLNMKETFVSDNMNLGIDLIEDDHNSLYNVLKDWYNLLKKQNYEK
jgi:hypothetical protein